MKAILVIDMPEYCGKCPCYHEGYGHCSINFRFVDDETQIPSWCPLRPLPSKRKNPITKTFGTPFNIGKVKGWNSCLKEITGETK